MFSAAGMNIDLLLRLAVDRLEPQRLDWTGLSRVVLCTQFRRRRHARVKLSSNCLPSSRSNRLAASSRCRRSVGFC